MIRYNSGISLSFNSNYVTFTNLNNITGSNYTAIAVAAATLTIINMGYINNNFYGLSLTAACFGTRILNWCALNNSYSTAIFSGGALVPGFYLPNFLSCSNNGGAAFSLAWCSNVLIRNLTANNNVTAQTLYGENVTLVNFTTDVSLPYISPIYGTPGRCSVQKLNGDVNSNAIITDGGNYITSLATDRAGGTGIMWKMFVVSTTTTANYPVWFRTATIAVVANKLVTVTAYMKKSHATNVSGALVARVNQIAWSDGTADLIFLCSSADTDWHQVSLTFTPTEAGVVEIECWSWYVAGTGQVYIEDMAISQAA